MIVRDLDAGTELTLGNVAELAWSDDGALLAMAIDVDGKTGNGVQVLEHAHRRDPLARRRRRDHYTGLAVAPHSDDLAAMRSRPTARSSTRATR